VFWAKALSIRLISSHGLKSVVSGITVRLQCESQSQSMALNRLKFVVSGFPVRLQCESHSQSMALDRLQSVGS